VSVAGPPEAPTGRGRRSRLVMRLIAFAVGCAGVGALAGVLWWRIVRLAVYTVGADGRATTSERGLTEFFAGDAWFCVIGVVLGAGLGVLGWLRFRTAGWVLVPVLAGAALVAGLMCWAVGVQLGPGDFTQRLAAARPGDLVPIELTLRAPVALVSWPFAAVIPVLLGSSLGRDDEEPRPILRRRSGPGAAEALDDRGLGR
jgi:hypothetical protein